MNKQEIYDYLDARQLWYEITEHEAVYTMEEAAAVDMPYPGADAKNLFLRDDKKQHYYLLTVKGDRRVDLREFRQRFHTRPLSFASERDLLSVLGLRPGSVTPLGLLNDAERRAELFLDSAFLEAPELIGIHPNDNTATIWMRTEDLVQIVREHGNMLHWIEG